MEKKFYLTEESKMSKKLAYIISAAVFVVLCGLIICEKLYPEVGSSLFAGLLG